MVHVFNTKCAYCGLHKVAILGINNIFIHSKAKLIMMSKPHVHVHVVTILLIIIRD